jgi:DNA-directed RNA polymerase subunit RPC12/RpoP
MNYTLACKKCGLSFLGEGTYCGECDPKSKTNPFSLTSKNFKTENTDLIICPNCGKEVDDSHGLFNEGEDEIEISCLYCNSRIKAEVEVTYVRKYSSYKIKND